MRLDIAMAACAAAALLSFAAPQRDLQERRTLEERVEKLEKALAATVDRTDALSAELAATTALLDQTVRYVQAQAHGAAALARTLDQSEQEGFTYGINPRSRELLLSGWRGSLRTARTGVPGLKPAERQALEDGEPEELELPGDGAYR